MPGYRIKNRDSLTIESICPWCEWLLRDPLQSSECGHRLCQTCAQEQQHHVFTCPQCSTQISKDTLKIDRGFRNDLQTLLVICWFCDWNGTLKNYPSHLVQNHPNPVCNHCGERFSTVSDFDQHELYQCKNIPVFCPLQALGCTEKMPRGALPEHYKGTQHQQSLLNAVVQVKSSINSSHSTQNDVAQLQETNSTVNILSEGVSVLDEDRQRLTSESIEQQKKLDTIGKDLAKVKTFMQGQNVLLNEITSSQDNGQEELQSMMEKINQMKTRTYDGTILWRLNDFKRILDDARSENQTSIYSPVFYTSPAGYKLCLQLFPNGDGAAKGKHMSLYIVLLRGEYDPILKFPFPFKIIFALIDQTKDQKHIIQAFAPEPNSSSFQRPRSDMNLPDGINKFVALKLLEKENNPYIRDDTMFIKAVIDFENIPTDLLTYVCNANPALPNSLQYGLIREEYERRRQREV